MTEYEKDRQKLRDEINTSISEFAEKYPISDLRIDVNVIDGGKDSVNGSRIYFVSGIDIDARIVI